VKVQPWLLNTLVAVVGVVWVSSFVASIFVPDYDPPESINLVFSSVMGALLIGNRYGNNGANGNDK
jgi:hypothetical protein